MPDMPASRMTPAKRCSWTSWPGKRRDPDAPRLPRVGGIDASAAMLERDVAEALRSAPPTKKSDAETSKFHRRAARCFAGTSRRACLSAPARSTGASPSPPRSGSARGPSRKTRRGTRTTRPCVGSSRVFVSRCGRARARAAGVPEDGPRDRGVRGGDSTRGTPDRRRRRRVPARKQKQKAVRVRAARRRRRRTRRRRESKREPARRRGVSWRGRARRASRVARLRDKRGRGNRTLDTRDEARDARSVRSRARRGAAARAAVAAARAGRGVASRVENAGTRGAASLVLVSGCWRRSTPRVPAARSPRRSTRRRTSRATGACVRARASASSRARGRVVAGRGAPKSERTDGERTDRANPRTSSRLEHSLRLTALGSPRRVETTSSHVRLECFSRSVAFGLSWRRRSATSASSRRRQGANAARESGKGREDSRTDSDSAHQENAGVAVLSRARARSARA